LFALDLEGIVLWEKEVDIFSIEGLAVAADGSVHVAFRGQPSDA
jgi:hypothetical protein